MKLPKKITLFKDKHFNTFQVNDGKLNVNFSITGKLALIYFVGVTFIWIFLVLECEYLINRTVTWWNNTYEWQRPVYVFSPLVKKGQKIELIDIKDVEKIIDEGIKKKNESKKQSGVIKEVIAKENIDYLKFFETIWDKESGKGTANAGHHIYCRNRKTWNEIGYSPQAKYCFENKTEAIITIKEWVENKCSNKTFDSCLCWWNEGKDKETCPYSDGNLSLAN